MAKKKPSSTETLSPSDDAKKGNARRRRWRIALLAFFVLLLLAALVVRWLLRPEYLAPAILDLAGDALGLEITATGIGEYRLRGTPQLIVRNVTAREKGSNKPVLTAERILISVPWSTLRARGRDLTATRLELDAPVFDIAAFQAWQSKRPPGETRIPTVTHGLRIVRGRVIGASWTIEALDGAIPSLAADKPLRAQLQGRYQTDTLRAPFDIALTLNKLGQASGVGVVGEIAPATAEWRLPTRIHLSGQLHTQDALRIDPLRVGASARYIAGDQSHPFALGIAGPLAFESGTVILRPAALALRGEGAIPTLDAAGGFSLAQELQLALEGQLREWPQAWPALPPPLGQSQAPLPFALGYAGKVDLSAIATLRLERDDTRFDGRFRLFDVLAWTDAFDNSTPLPPLSGRLTTPHLEVSGAVLRGVEIEMEDPTIPTEAAIQ
ncbi:MULTISPECIES: hypothetical protein [unclassified Pseudoxanthomonas]|uniref:hypothetical protein n=1 Tax=unclassified Pseudoxanthomonas TaxID=2645906 RepID=UPI003076D530